MYSIFGVQYIFELQVCRQSSASTACDKLAIGRNPTSSSDEGKGCSITALGISHLRMTSIKSLPRYARWQKQLRHDCNHHSLATVTQRGHAPRWRGARLRRERPVRRQHRASDRLSSRVSSASGPTLVSPSQRSRLSSRRLASPTRLHAVA